MKLLLPFFPDLKNFMDGVPGFAWNRWIGLARALDPTIPNRAKDQETLEKMAEDAHEKINKIWREPNGIEAGHTKLEMYKAFGYSDDEAKKDMFVRAYLREVSPTMHWTMGNLIRG